MNEDLLQRIIRLERQLQDLSERYDRGNNSTSQEFTKKVILRGGLSLNGGSLGSVGDVMSVYGKAPVAQAASIATVSTVGPTYTQSEINAIVTAVNNINIAIDNFGITA